MHKKSLAIFSILFFFFGFITCLNDILVPYLKAAFTLDYGQAALIQLCFFGAYGVMSIPASRLIEKVGYKHGVIIGFIITAMGCVLFWPAVSYRTYGLFLMALFVLATGIVILQVAANPYVAALGSTETASSRLTMTQALNSLGTFLAPFFGSYFILSSLNLSGSVDGVKWPYLFIALVLILSAFIFSRVQLPDLRTTHEDGGFASLFKSKNFIMGMIGIFVYVGAEVGIGTFFVNYAIENMGLAEADAAKLVAFYWGGAMVGRFIGIATLKVWRPGIVLAVHGLISTILIIVSIKTTGETSVYSLLFVGIFNSIMFPTIFTLALKDLKSHEKASGLLATSIIGGAIIPFIMGQFADSIGLKNALLLPIFCYVFVIFYGWYSRKSEVSAEMIEAV
jgi:FHS family L-fucose permease-like MFS transporter